jgi:RNA recognition motif-containing protein
MKLHIGGMPKTLTDAQLSDLITPFGKPSSVEIVKDPTGASKGFGFAEFANDDQARAVIAGLDGKAVDGQPLRVSEARPRKEKTGPRV